MKYYIIWWSSSGSWRPAFQRVLDISNGFNRTMSSDVLRSELLTPRGHRSMSCSHTQGTEARVDKSVLKQYSWITVQWLTVCCAWRPHIMIYSGFALLWFSIGVVLVLISIGGVPQCSWSCRAQAGADGNTSRRNLGGSTTFRGLCHIWKEIDWKSAKLPHSVICSILLPDLF